MSTIEVIFPGNKKVDAAVDGYKIRTDQTKKNGGEETAPEPFTLFLASLATCAGIFAKSFCDTREIDTRGMTLFLTPYFKKGLPHMDRLEITLHVNQDFPEKYIKAVIKAMEGCAVKNQLHPDIRTETRVAYLET